MERTRSGVTRERSGHIQLRAARLDAKLERLGYTSFRAKAEFLGVGVATLHSAYQGNPVYETLIFACRTRLPKVEYEHLFREVES